MKMLACSDERRAQAIATCTTVLLHKDITGAIAQDRTTRDLNMS